MSETDDQHALSPRTNPELIGHPGAEARLLQAWTSGRLPHGWLIAGPKGIGKATLAYRFGRFMLANGDPGAADDGPGLFGDELPPAVPKNLAMDAEAPVFRRVAASGHADLMVIEKGGEGAEGKTEIVVDQIRRAVHFFSVTAAEGGWRVVIVDGADDMNPSAANALLKVLEEPPERALVILVSHAPGRLLPTIRSRCCRLTLHPLANDIVGEIVQKHRPDIGAGDLPALAALADGSPGRAIELADTDGLDLYKMIVGLTGTLPSLDVAAVHALGDRLARRDAEPAYRTATDLMRRWIARIATGTGGDTIVGEGEMIAKLRDLGDLEQWIGVWDKVSRLIADADRLNLDRKQIVINAFHAMQRAANG